MMNDTKEPQNIDFSRYLYKIPGTDAQGVRSSIAAVKELEEYERCMKQGEIINMRFSLADVNGDLLRHDGACLIKLPNKEINGREYDSTLRARRLDKEYAVKVLSVDRDSKTVIVSHCAVRQVDRDRLIECLDNGIKQDIFVKVPAKVIISYNNIAILDIGGLGIPGYIKVENWSNEYTETLSVFASGGDVINVAVVDKGGLSQNRRKRFFRWSDMEPYVCSRKLLVSDNPWLGIEQKVPEKSVVRVRCVERKERCFFASIEGVPEIQAYCYYPDGNASLKASDIVPGCYYEGYVKQVDEAAKRLRVRVFKRVE